MTRCSSIPRRITGAAAYLSEAHGPGSLRGIVPDTVARLRSELAVAEALRIRTRCEGRWDGYVTGMLPVRTPVPGLRGGTAYRVDVGSAEGGGGKGRRGSGIAPGRAAAHRRGSG